MLNRLKITLLALCFLSSPALAGGSISGGSSSTSATPGGSSGQIQYNNAGAFGGLSNSATLAQLAGVKGWPTKRVPTSADDTTYGYKAGDFWNYNGQIWVNISAAAGTAVWQPQQQLSAPVCNQVGGCAGAYGVFRLNSAYTGAAFNLIRASDSTNMDIPFDVNGNASWTTADAFCAGTTCTVAKWYDQSGNSYDIAQSTVANQPRVFGSYVANQRAITFDGRNVTSGIGRYLTNSSLPITNRQNLTIFMVAKTSGSGGNVGDAFFDIGYSTQKLSVFTNTGAQGNISYNGGSSVAWATNLRASTAQVYTIVDNAGTMSIQQNNYLTTGSAGSVSSSAATGILVGGTALISYPGSYDMTAFIIYNSALTATQQATVQQSLYQTTGIQPQINDAIIGVGDSQMCCVTTSGVGPSQLWLGFEPNANDHPLNFYNNGFPGQLLQTMAGYSSTVYTYGGVAGANVLRGDLIAGGTNDIAAGATAAAVYGYYQTICTAVHTAGNKCIISSTMPRNSGFSNGVTATSFETTRQSLESMLVSGWSSFADGFDDIAADPIIGPQSAGTNTTYFPDGIHPSSPLGTSIEANAHARGLRPLLQ